MLFFMFQLYPQNVKSSVSFGVLWISVDANILAEQILFVCVDVLIGAGVEKLEKPEVFLFVCRSRDVRICHENLQFLSTFEKQTSHDIKIFCRKNGYSSIEILLKPVFSLTNTQKLKAPGSKKRIPWRWSANCDHRWKIKTF